MLAQNQDLLTGDRVCIRDQADPSYAAHAGAADPFPDPIVNQDWTQTNARADRRPGPDAALARDRRDDLAHRTAIGPRPVRPPGCDRLFGPVLAGGRVLVTSSGGELLSFDPETGAPAGAVRLSAGSTTGPAVANGSIFVLSRDGALHALR